MRTLTTAITTTKKETFFDTETPLKLPILGPLTETTVTKTCGQFFDPKTA